jgi:hydrogenase maturation factor
LPVDAISLVYQMNQRDRLGEYTIVHRGTVLSEYTNGSVANALGAIVTLIVVWLGVRTLLSVAGVL